MTSSLRRFKNEFSRIWPLLNRINWQAVPFTPEKAYVTAVFSKIAYLTIPHFEVRYHTLAKVIPCLTYRQLLASGRTQDIREFLRALDFGNAFVVTTHYVVAVGVITPHVIIIALRGTRPLYISDWMIDFNSIRTTTQVNSWEVKLHSGFFVAMTDCLDEIAFELQKRTGSGSPQTPIYVVGHSLGGALAAIAHALSRTTFSSYHRYGLAKTAALNTHSSFSFGMPRYGDNRAISNLRTPFHIYNDRDLVPGVPTKWMGFESVPIEYRSGEGGSLNQKAQDRQSLRWWFSRVHLARGVRHHLIERYIRRLGKAAGVY
jgi:hypothetical protein